MSKPILEPNALTPLLEREYGLAPPIICELIRRGFNDHYRVTAGGESAISRVYLEGKYYISSAADFRFELDPLDFLARRGVSDTQLALIPTFARIRQIWDTGDILAMHAVWGDEPDATACDEILEMLEQVSLADG